MNLLERLKSKGAKRILSLDGGGIRGALTLGYLEKIERILRERHANPQLKLCEYFDLIGGTSTGSIIAAGLAIGKDVAEIKELYLRLGERVFSRNWAWRLLHSYFSAKNLRQELETVFGDITFGDSAVKTGLCVFAKRADTGGTWAVVNHPEAKYYNDGENDNKDIMLRRFVRASTAAPTYFDPETIDVGRGKIGAFVDGGVSMVNNPALMLFSMAALQGFPFHWELGEDKILLVSIGTGTWRLVNNVDAVTGAWLTTWASKIPSMLMYDANRQNQMMLQFLSRTKTPWLIDREIGNMSEDLLTEKPLLTYLRYNALLDENGMNGLGLSAMVPKLDSLRDMSKGKNVADLMEIGDKAAPEHIVEEHFPAAFDLKVL